MLCFTMLSWSRDGYLLLSYLRISVFLKVGMGLGCDGFDQVDMELKKFFGAWIVPKWSSFSFVVSGLFLVLCVFS